MGRFGNTESGMPSSDARISRKESGESSKGLGIEEPECVHVYMHVFVSSANSM